VDFRWAFDTSALQLVPISAKKFSYFCRVILVETLRKNVAVVAVAAVVPARGAPRWPTAGRAALDREDTVSLRMRAALGNF
jgi:hypothetical protein